jgi:hypothetical protein
MQYWPVSEYLLRYDATAVVQLAVVAISTVTDMHFTCDCAGIQLDTIHFVVGTAFGGAGFRVPAFWIWHIRKSLET